MVAGTGEAPCAVMSYDSDNLPDEYRGDLLVTSWGDHRLERFHLRPRGASFSAEMTPVIRGGENFRPVGLALAPDGSLYMSDWVDKSYNLHGKGRVWRVSAKNPPKRPEYRDYWDALSSKHGPMREAAVRNIPKRAANRQGAAKLLLDSEDEAVQVAAARTLDVTDFYSQSLLLGVVGSHPSPDVRYGVVESLSVEAGKLYADQEVELRAAWIEGLTDDRDLPPAIVAQVLARPRLNSYPAVLLYRNMQQYYDRQSGHNSPPSAAYWNAIAEDPFLLHAVSGAIAIDVAGSRRLDIRSEQELKRLDSKVVEERLAGALAVKKSQRVALEEVCADFVADSDPRIQLIGLQWLAESDRSRAIQYRRRLENLLQRPNITRQVFEVAIAVLNQIDGINPDPKNEAGGDVFVLRMLLDEKAAPATRRFALRTLRPIIPS
jgi:hypothetical protein